METQTAFDLNRAIQRWRDQLSQSPHFRPENLEELEAHLRDSAAAVQRAGLSEEEAFLVAARRLGGGPVLEPEFAKVNVREVWMNRLLWMVTGVLLWGAISSLSSVAAHIGVSAGLLSLGYAPSSSAILLPGILLGVVQLVSLALGVVGCWWLLGRAGGSLGKTTACLVRSPGRIFLAVLAISLVLGAGYAASWIEGAYLANRLGPTSYGALVYSKSLSLLVTGPLETLALVAWALLLARDRLRRGIKA